MPMADMLGSMKSEPESSPGMGEDDGESMAKEEAGKALASALGMKGEVDGKAVCEAVKTILELESYDEE
jgi:hypothetical protein